MLCVHIVSVLHFHAVLLLVCSKGKRIDSKHVKGKEDAAERSVADTDMKKLLTSKSIVQTDELVRHRRARQITPRAAMDALRVYLEQCGVLFEDKRIKDVRVSGGKAMSIVCEGVSRSVKLDHLIVATGAWIPDFLLKIAPELNEVVAQGGVGLTIQYAKPLPAVSLFMYEYQMPETKQ